jgi:hypothetical protein
MAKGKHKISSKSATNSNHQKGSRNSNGAKRKHSEEDDEELEFSPTKKSLRTPPNSSVNKIETSLIVKTLSTPNSMSSSSTPGSTKSSSSRSAGFGGILKQKCTLKQTSHANRDNKLRTKNKNAMNFSTTTDNQLSEEEIDEDDHESNDEGEDYEEVEEVKKFPVDYYMQDISSLTIPTYNSPNEIRMDKFLNESDVAIGVESAKVLLSCRGLQAVLHRKHHAKIYIIINRKHVNLNAHFYLLKFLQYNMVCEGGFSTTRSVDIAGEKLSDDSFWEHGAILSKNLVKAFVTDVRLRKIIDRDVENVKNRAKDKCDIWLRSLKNVIPDFDDEYQILRPLICSANYTM